MPKTKEIEYELDDEVNAPLDESSDSISKLEQKPVKDVFMLKEGLLGKAVNALFSLIAKRYPRVESELTLTDDEVDLVDEALRSPIASILRKIGMTADELNILLGLATIFVPRILIIVSEERKLHDFKPNKTEESQSRGMANVQSSLP